MDKAIPNFVLISSNESVAIVSKLGLVFPTPMAVHWEPWEDIATDTDADRSRTAVEAQTGYCSATLDVLWEDAQHYFMQVPTGKRRRRYFFAVLKYIHM